MRAAVKALEGEISQRRTSHSDSDSACHLVENRSAADWAAHARELGHGMGSLVAQAEEASQEHGGRRVALMESLYAVKRAELEAVSKYRTLEDELLAAKLKIAAMRGPLGTAAASSWGCAVVTRACSSWASSVTAMVI